MVDRLVRAHYVSPTTAQADRRRTELRLSAEGRSLLDGFRRGARADLAKTLSDATPAELAVVMQALAILKARFVHD
jgi:DNA-binding MarR family transcriptional regulator